MKFSKKIIYLILIGCIIVGLGYYRDFVFKNLNALIQSQEFTFDFSMPYSLSFFENVEASTLIKIKWLLTFICAILYLTLSILSIQLLFKNKTYLWIVIWTYLILAFISAVFMLTGFFFPGISGNMYLFSRYLMGIAQSPLVLMILIPAFKISEKESKKITN